MSADKPAKATSFLQAPVKTGRESLSHRIKREIGPALKGVYAANWFRRRGRTAVERKLRSDLLTRFRKAAAGLQCEHQEREILVMADFLLLTAPEGDIVECGCYQGGSTVKLSILAAATNRKLYVCDGFSGLPQTSSVEENYRNVTGHSVAVQTGRFAASLDQVRANIARGGEAGACEFVAGYFHETLPLLAVRPALIFSDAKPIGSTRDVLRSLWPRLRPGGRLWIHDSTIPVLVQSAFDPDWWQAEIGEPPPLLYGAGWGLGFGAENIAFAEKR